MMLKSQATIIMRISTHRKQRMRKQLTAVWEFSLRRQQALETFMNSHNKTPLARRETMTTYHSNMMLKLWLVKGARIKDVIGPTRDRVSICSAWTVLERIETILSHSSHWLTMTMSLRCSKWQRAAVDWLSHRNGSLSSMTRKKRPTMSGSKSRQVQSIREFNTFHNITSHNINTITPCLTILVSTIQAITIRLAISSRRRRNRNLCKRHLRSQSRQWEKTLITRNNFIFNIKAGERTSLWSKSLRRRKSELKATRKWVKMKYSNFMFGFLFCRSHLNIAGIENFPSIQDHLPHCWSEPALGNILRHNLEPPLLQQAAFDDTVSWKFERFTTS